MRLIDAELTQRSVSAQMVQTLHGGNKEAEEMMRYYNPSSFLAGVSFGMELASKIIHNAPTVEAKPVVHGEWIKSESMIRSGRCSVCNCWITRHSVNENWFRYCPHCGADMRKKVE